MMPGTRSRRSAPTTPRSTSWPTCSPAAGRHASIDGWCTSCKSRRTWWRSRMAVASTANSRSMPPPAPAATSASFGGKADQLNYYNYFVGTPDYFQKDLDRYRRVTPAAVQRAAQTYLTGAHRVVLSVVPQEKPELAVKERS